MNQHHDMPCQDARRSIPSYLDGELTEAQAAPLRRHLLDCQPCRASAQSDKNLKRWFVEPAAVTVPRDFAARVARRAFAGDTAEGRGAPTLVPVLAGGGAEDVLVPRGPRGLVTGRAATAPRPEDRHLRFVLALTAAAAAVLFVVSLSIRSLSVPNGPDLRANDTRSMSAEEALRTLDRLNANDASARAGTGAAGTQTPGVPAPGTKHATGTPERRP